MSERLSQPREADAQPAPVRVLIVDDETLFVRAVEKRLVKEGYASVAAAFARLHAAHPDARLVIVGCRPPIAAPNVDIVGYCPVESIHQHYREASIFCLPVHREPFGVAFVEAMHHALLIVATRVRAVRDLVKDDVNGFLIEVGDVDALTACLERLLSDPDLRVKMGDQSREFARSGYTWPGVVAKMAAAIREIRLCSGSRIGASC